MKTKNDAIRYDMKQRAYDGKWELLAVIKDYDNAYTYTTEGGLKRTEIPTKWVTVGVYDYLMVIDKEG